MGNLMVCLIRDKRFLKMLFDYIMIVHTSSTPCNCGIEPLNEWLLIDILKMPLAYFGICRSVKSRLII